MVGVQIFHIPDIPDIPSIPLFHCFLPYSFQPTCGNAPGMSRNESRQRFLLAQGAKWEE
jgi:hypothetical protein